MAMECVKRDYVCQYCNFNATYEVMVKTHWPVCIFFPIQCPNFCGVTCERDVVKDHMRMCRLEEVVCEFSGMGCDKRFRRVDQEEHTRQNSLKHLSMTAAASVKINQKLQQKLLEEETKLQEQEGKLQEQEKKLQEQETKLQEQELKFNFFLEKQEEKLQEQEEKLQEQEEKLQEQEEKLQEQEEKLQEQEEKLQEHEEKLQEQELKFKYKFEEQKKRLIEQGRELQEEKQKTAREFR